MNINKKFTWKAEELADTILKHEVRVLTLLGFKTYYRSYNNQYSVAGERRDK